MRRCVCRIGYQPHCQGQNWTVVTLLIENGRASSVCSNLQTDLPIRRLVSLAQGSTLFLPSPLKDPGYRWLLSAIRCCVADVTAFIVTVIYWLRMTTATGRNTSKRGQALVKGSDWMPSPPNNFHPIPLRTAHFASGYCLAICCLLSLSTTPLSKHALCAKWYHLPFAPIIQLHRLFSRFLLFVLLAA